MTLGTYTNFYVHTCTSKPKTTHCQVSHVHTLDASIVRTHSLAPPSTAKLSYSQPAGVNAQQNI
jgi:hypothetical protein